MAKRNNFTLAALHVRIPDVSADKDPLLLQLYEEAIAKFRALTNLKGIVPMAARPLLREMVAIAYNRLKSEGLTGTGMQGVSESYLDGLPTDLMASIMEYKVKKLKGY
jgi:hypothetical protein